MADFMLHRKISVDTYPFPEGAFKIYGGGKFYNGFAIGASNNLTVINEDGVLKFSRGAEKGQEKTTVILGTIPPNNKASIYVDVASPQPPSTIPTTGPGFLINNSSLFVADWSEVKIYNTRDSESNKRTLQAGGTLSIFFESASDSPAIPNLCSVRALWVL